MAGSKALLQVLPRTAKALVVEGVACPIAVPAHVESLTAKGCSVSCLRPLPPRLQELRLLRCTHFGEPESKSGHVAASAEHHQQRGFLLRLPDLRVLEVDSFTFNEPLGQPLPPRLRALRLRCAAFARALPPLPPALQELRGTHPSGDAEDADYDERKPLHSAWAGTIGALPPGLRVLHLGGAFEGPLPPLLPLGLRELALGAEYTCALPPALPPALETLRLGACTGSDTLPPLPDTLLELVVSPHHRLPTRLPPHLRTLDTRGCGGGGGGGATQRPRPADDALPPRLQHYAVDTVEFDEVRPPPLPRALRSLGGGARHKLRLPAAPLPRWLRALSVRCTPACAVDLPGLLPRTLERLDLDCACEIHAGACRSGACSGALGLSFAPCAALATLNLNVRALPPRLRALDLRGAALDGCALPPTLRALRIDSWTHLISNRDFGVTWSASSRGAVPCALRLPPLLRVVWAGGSIGLPLPLPPLPFATVFADEVSGAREHVAPGMCRAASVFSSDDAAEVSFERLF
ncbi:hypothetical protein JKP88DRAFT_285143 [Tribonema minus]|uniref:Uncharacterized protein n=1 Tax=Tribonema minus TaxID=303371 RepID=A0A835ZMJ7_9STRA|nr:hypothetical protein JKP88DRAFT_285143 [Tribonema minus]